MEGDPSRAAPGPSLPAVPWYSRATNTWSIACVLRGDARASSTWLLKAAGSLRGRQRLPGVGDLEPPQAVTFSGPLARSQGIFQPESLRPKINSGTFTAASLHFSFGIPDAYVPTWAETGFGKFIWVQQHHQCSSASLWNVISACLSQPEQCHFVVFTWEGGEKGEGGIGSAQAQNTQTWASKSLWPMLVSSDLYQSPILSLTDY